MERSIFGAVAILKQIFFTVGCAASLPLRIARFRKACSSASFTMAKLIVLSMSPIVFTTSTVSSRPIRGFLAPVGPAVRFFLLPFFDMAFTQHLIENFIQFQMAVVTDTFVFNRDGHGISTFGNQEL